MTESDPEKTYRYLPPELANLHLNAWTAPYWAAATEHRLVAPQCVNCGEFRMPPTPFCWNCRTQDIEWATLPGTGTVYTWTICRQAFIPVMKAALPYVIAVVELEGAPGVRLVTNIVDTDPNSVSIGQRVKVVWDDVTDEITIPRFTPIGPDAPASVPI